jgi:uncharacterized membrane protein
MQFMRALKHLFSTRAVTRARFPASLEHAVSAAVSRVEARTSGEIRFVIETALELSELWSGITPRERALQVFAQLGVWDTELRNGVLIYVLAADRDVEIVADRGAATRISPTEWEGVCRLIESHFREGRFQDGALAGVEAVGGLLEREFPSRSGNRDELPNQPTLL